MFAAAARIALATMAFAASVAFSPLAFASEVNYVAQGACLQHAGLYEVRIYEANRLSATSLDVTSEMTTAGYKAVSGNGSIYSCDIAGHTVVIEVANYFSGSTKPCYGGPSAEANLLVDGRNILPLGSVIGNSNTPNGCVSASEQHLIFWPFTDPSNTKTFLLIYCRNSTPKNDEFDKPVMKMAECERYSYKPDAHTLQQLVMITMEQPR